MGQNIVIIILAVAVIIEGGMLLKNSKVKPVVPTQTVKQTTLPPAGPNEKGRPKPIILSKGMNLKTTPLFDYAYQIAPGELSDKAKKALIGMNIDTKTQSDGSIVVTISPKDSEEQNQQYTIKTGQVLYFIEQTPADDKADSDKDLNYRDDYGIITDKDGLIQ